MTNDTPDVARREPANVRRHLRHEVILLTALTIGVAVALATGARTIAYATGLAQASAVFEAVSVKENRLGHKERRPATVRLLPDGRYVATNVTARWLILKAHDLASFQVIGGPNWLATDRFDVDGTIPAGVDERRVPEMLRRLVSERFGLVAGKETRDLDVYRLVQDSRGLGRNIRRVSAQCESTIVARNEAAARGQLDGPSTALSSPDARRERCSSTVSSSRRGVSLTGRPLAMLAYWLQDEVGRPVMDRTGLPGLYDLNVTWDAGEQGDHSRRESIAKALREQVGLKLEPMTESFEVLVVEQIHHPIPE